MIQQGLANSVNVQHGMTQEQFRAALESPENRGSIVFSRLDPDWTESFREADAATDGLQTAKEARPFRVQPTPENVQYKTGGPRLVNSERKDIWSQLSS